MSFLQLHDEIDCILVVHIFYAVELFLRALQGVTNNFLRIILALTIADEVVEEPSLVECKFELQRVCMMKTLSTISTPFECLLGHFLQRLDAILYDCF